jgi:hypothetical protein
VQLIHYPDVVAPSSVFQFLVDLIWLDVEHSLSVYVIMVAIPVIMVALYAKRRGLLDINRILPSVHADCSRGTASRESERRSGFIRYILHEEFSLGSGTT